MALPQEIEWNIIKFMSHPCADIMKEIIACAETKDYWERPTQEGGRIFLNFQEIYFRAYHNYTFLHLLPPWHWLLKRNISHPRGD